MEGDSSSYSSDVKEQSSGELDYSLGVNRVVRIPGLDRGFQALSREFMFLDKSPVNARDTCPTVYKGLGVNGFHRVRGDNKLDWNLHSG